VSLKLDGAEKTGLISGYWLYFESEGQYYKLSAKKYGLDVAEILEGKLELRTRQTVPKTEEELREAKKARRAARKARKAGEEEDEDEEDEAVEPGPSVEELAEKMRLAGGEE
jgi:hypothetical protein